MKKSEKKRELSDLERQECAALNAIYKAKKKTLGITQEKIAIEGLRANSQSAASHYLTGRNALNAEAASVFARYLQEPVESFSPRLADEIARMASAVERPTTPAGAGRAEPGADSDVERANEKDHDSLGRKYQDAKYIKASPEHRKVVDEVADQLLEMTPEQAKTLKQVMELLAKGDDDRSKN